MEEEEEDADEDVEGGGEEEGEAEYYQLPEFGSSCRGGGRGEGGLRLVVSDVLVEAEGKGSRIGGDARKCLAGIQRGVRRRLVICRYIWPHMLAMALTYTVTLSLYPGVETLIQSCSLAHWITIILMVTFNITDLVGKVMAGLCSSWSRVSLVLGPLARICLVPLLLVAAAG